MARLTDVEIARVRQIQIDLGAVKTCRDCGEQRPVQAFKEFGWPSCNACEGVVLETYWTRLKAQVASKRAAVVGA